MSYVVNLHLAYRRVVIVGGGKVALRKAKQLLQEHAVVVVVAFAIEEEFYQLPVELHRKKYEESDLKDAYFCIAATNESSVNQQVLADANQRSMFCMCVQQDQLASMQAMVSTNEEQYTLALSTNGAYPLLNERMLHTLQDVMEETFVSKLACLKTLRSIYKGNVDALKTLLDIPLSGLQFLLEALNKKKAILFVYHGSKQATAIQEVRMFEQHQRKKYPNVAVSSCFMAQHILVSVQDEIAFLEPILQVLQGNVEVKAIPMMIQDGTYYQQYCLLMKKYGFPSTPLLFMKDERRQQFLQTIQQEYRNERSLILLFHDEIEQFKKVPCVTKPLIHCMGVSEYATFMETKHEPTFVISCFILSGFHHQALTSISSGDRIVTTSFLQTTYLQPIVESYIEASVK